MDKDSELYALRRLAHVLGNIISTTQPQMPKCKFCGSTRLVRNGHRKGTQYWLCKHCGKGSVDNAALPGMRYPTETIGSALWQYYTGASLNDIRGYIEQHSGQRPSDSTIFNWVKHFTKLAVNEADARHPKVGDTWVADETVLKVGGRNVWLFDIIDEDTRFLLATRLSASRTKEDAQLLMNRARRKAGKNPKTVVTDSLRSYLDVRYGSGAEHIKGGPFNIENNTNLIERFHGTLKDRLKVMRGLKHMDTADTAIKGWLVWYNYFRPHESLDNQTPAEVASVRLPYKNWLEVAKSEEPNLIIEPGTKVEYRLRKTPNKPRPRKGVRSNRRVGRLETTLGGVNG